MLLDGSRELTGKVVGSIPDVVADPPRILLVKSKVSISAQHIAETKRRDYLDRIAAAEIAFQLYTKLTSSLKGDTSKFNLIFAWVPRSIELFARYSSNFVLFQTVEKFDASVLAALVTFEFLVGLEPRATDGIEPPLL